MWKVTLAVLAQRGLLLIPLLIALVLPNLGNHRKATQLFSWDEVTVVIDKHIRETPEYRTMEALRGASPWEAVRRAYHPFTWITHALSRVSGLSIIATLLLVSNALLFLFLAELHTLFNRLTVPEAATGATILCALWPTTYELSLGSALVLTFFLVAWVLRTALDNKWLFCGIGSALLALSEPVILGMLPLLLYIFLYYQRHFQMGVVIKRAVFFVLPLGAALYWSNQNYLSVSELLLGSSLFSLYQSLGTGGYATQWVVSKSYLGQTLSLVFLLVGTVITLFRGSVPLQRAIALGMFIVFLLFSSYGTIASRTLIAAVCFEGIASASSASVLWFTQLAFIMLAAWEVFVIFR